MRDLLKNHGLLLCFVFAAALLAGFVTLAPADPLATDSSLLGLGLAVSIVKFSTAVVSVWLALRAMDLTLGAQFGGVLNEIKHGSLGMAVYYGARFVAVCLLAGAIYS